MDHEPEVPDKIYDFNPHTGEVLSGPAKAAKQGLFDY
jgi:hypothetical protein